jgi:FtsP/CotA-like multicopper oxidase with cupredoxin domain
LLPSLASAQDTLSAAQAAQPEGWDSELAMQQPRDLNPAPDILEVELEAVITPMEILPGTTTPVWTYNGILPGPLLKLNVGDRLIVHFTNKLDVETTIHWHGLRVPNAMDGAPGFTQEPIPAGGSFTYDFVVPDAGTFWYHPHSDSAAQVGYGLYGALIVNDPDDPLVFGDELVLLLSDMSIAENGSFQSAHSGGSFGDLFGREGNVLLVNGKVLPTLQLRQGKQQRWRVINATRSRYYKRAPMFRLGGDSGLMARSEALTQIQLTPGERTDFVFTPPDAPGTADVFKWYPTDRGYGTTYLRLSEPIMNMVTVDLPAVTPEPIPAELRTIEPIDISGAAEQEVEMTIDLSGNDVVVMGFNGVPHHRAIPIVARVGETQVWTVKNPTDFSHPFHLHGFFFQVLDDSRVPEWKDTVDVPHHSELKLAVRFDDRPGMWMYHCHILDHAEVGMMGHLQVLAEGDVAGEHAGH